MLDPLEVQRLVDGEQNAESHRRILNMAEQNPDCWREIALAFLEDQQFRLAMQNRLSETALIPGLETPTPGQEKQHLAPSRKPDALQANWVRFFAISTVVLLSCFIGFQIGQSGSSPIERTVAGKSPVGERGIQAEPADGMNPGAGMKLVDQTSVREDSMPPDPMNTTEQYVRNASMADLQNANISLEDAQGNQMSLPMVDFQQGQRYINQRVPEQMRARLLDSGYNVNENIRYISGRLSDGRQIVLPVKSYRFSLGQ